MAKIVYAKSGGKLVKKWRCTSGKRKGRLVAEPKNCFKPIDVKKRARMRRMRRQKDAIITRKTAITKRVDPVSKQVKRLNQTLESIIHGEDNGK